MKGAPVTPIRGTRTARLAGNPWNLTLREAQCVWMLAEFNVTDMAVQLGLSRSTVNGCLINAYGKMGVHHSAAAAVQFDRWWQNHKKLVNDATVRLFEIELLEPRVAAS